MRNFIHYLLLILIIGPGFAAFAQTLPPLTNVTVTPLLPASVVPTIPCDQLAAAITAYGKMVGQNISGVSAFLDNIATGATNWYNLLVPLEGTTQTVAVGTFQPIQDGATQISQIEGYNDQDAGLLVKQMALINKSLAACTIVPK